MPSCAATVARTLEQCSRSRIFWRSPSVRYGRPNLNPVNDMSAETECELLKFRHNLASLMTDDENLRPFICDGNPYDCHIFLVGFNPATELSGTFWEHWDNKSGFDKRKWLESYKIERARRPLKPGKIRRLPVSNSRRVIEWMVSAAAPARFLETNLYSKPTPSACELPQKDRDTKIFDFLLKELNPLALVLHGTHAKHHFEQQNRIHLKLDEVSICDGRMVIAVPHFSRGWSEERAVGVIRKVLSVSSPI